MAYKLLTVLTACLCLAGLASAQSQSPMEVQLAIAIPASSGAAVLRPAATAVIPVSILSSSAFDATQVDPKSLGFVAVRVKLFATPASCQVRDMNADGRLDLFCTFQARPSLAEPGVSPAVLEGRMFNGLRIRGHSMVRILPREVPR